MSLEYVPDRPINPPEDTRKKVYECNGCDCDIKEGDGYYIVGGEYYCDDCVERNHHYAEDYADNWDDIELGGF